MVPAFTPSEGAPPPLKKDLAMPRNGADTLAQTLADLGVDTCFANPGTTEMHLLAALGREERISLHLCLFEGVATGAADGYGRMKRRPALSLLHLGPGLANGMANLHNARKAATPVLTLVGEHASYHAQLGAPLTADIDGMARTVSDWVATPRNAGEMAALAARMVAATQGSERVATLIVPNDAAWDNDDTLAPVCEAAEPDVPADADIAAAAAALRPGSALLLGAPFLSARMAALATAIGTSTGCTFLAEAAVARMERGRGVAPLNRIPFHVDFATEALKSLHTAVLVGAGDPVAFFAYPDRPSRLLPPECRVLPLAGPLADVEDVLERLAAAVGAVPGPVALRDLPPAPEAVPITPQTLATAVAQALPEGAIVVDESITSGGPLFGLCADAAPHDWINNRGGSIGYSMPVAVGCAAACPDRPVLCLTGDGSAMYTLQALWTMARARMNVTVVVLANRRYNILANETSKIGAGEPVSSTMPLLSLEDPAPDWVRLAEGLGVTAARCDTAAQLTGALRRALASAGPHLIEAVL
jgi:acetolactate synthase-1/2/3 large subunit